MMLDVALVQTIDRRRVRRSRWSWERRERAGMPPAYALTVRSVLRRLVSR